MHPVFRIWLHSDGKAFGEGPYRLLKGIEETGSLRKTAAEQKISYRKAWNILKDIEKKLGFRVLDRRVGGVSGGGSALTADAKTLVGNYERFQAEAHEVLEQLYRKHFEGSQQL